MRRGFLWLRSSSAPRPGRIALDYFREIALVSFIIIAAYGLQQAWDGPKAAVRELPHAEHPVYGLAVSNDGRTLWVSREHYGMTEIRLADGAEIEHSLLLQSEASYTAFGGGQQPLTLRISVERALELLHGHEVIHRETLPASAGFVTDSDVSSDGRMAVVATSANLMKTWELDAQGMIQSHEWSVPEQVDHVQFSPDGRKLAVVNWGIVVVYDVASHSEDGRWTVKHGAKPRGRDNRGVMVAWAPEATHLAIAFDDGIVRMWDCASKNLVWERLADPYQTSALAFDSTGKKIATGGFDKSVRLWDWRSDRLVWESEHHSRAVHNLIFAVDGTRLYTGGLDGAVCECDVTNGKVLREMP